MKIRKILILSVLLLSTCVMFAQRPGGGRQMPTIGVLSATIVDDQGNPVEYATVSLISKRDSSLLTGGITDKKGYFKLSELRLGVYILDIKFLGFEHKQIKPIYLFPKGRGKGQGTEQNLGKIKLENSDVALDDVNVVADKSHVQYKIDKKVVNVSQDINSASGSVVDILENTPSVNVDIDGNVELRGSSNFTVLIDGKPTVLEASEVLQQIPANLVENIEIITNPSAKFDPDGAAGIINVVLKKKKSLGLNGLINISAGTGDKYKGNAIFNYKVGKLNFTAGFDYRDEKRFGQGKVNQISKDTINDIDYYSNYDGDRDMNIYGYGFQGGIDYYINDNNTLSVLGKYNNREFSRTSESYYHDYSVPQGDEYYMRLSDMGYNGSSYNINFNYALKFKKPEQKLDALFYYSYRDGTRMDDQFKYITDQKRNLTDDEPELNKADEIGPREQYRYKLDFVSPLGANGMFEAGYQGRYETDNEKLVYSNYNSTTNNWDVDAEKSNETEYIRNIQAAYATYANKFLGFDYKVGLRAEYMDRTLEQLKDNENFVINRFDLFPSAYITRQLSKTQQMQLNYSRRINRPRGRQLDPHPSYSNPKRIRQGNPELEPEYVDSYEFNFQQQFKKSFVSFELYYRKRNNKIDRVTVPISGDTVLSTYQNLNYDNSIGAEINANLSLAKWWRLNISGTGYYYQLFGEIEEEDVNNESFNYNFRLNNTFSLKTKTKIQLSAFYRGPSVTSQGTRDYMLFTNLAVRQDLVKGKLSVTASFRDIFNGRRYKFTTDTETLYSDLEFSREGQVFTLALTYRLNNFKQKRNGRNGNGNGEDMDMDMDM